MGTSRTGSTAENGECQKPRISINLCIKKIGAVSAPIFFCVSSILVFNIDVIGDRRSAPFFQLKFGDFKLLEMAFELGGVDQVLFSVMDCANPAFKYIAVDLLFRHRQKSSSF